MKGKKPTFAHDPGEQIFFVGFAGIDFSNEEVIREVFAEVRQYWLTHCKGRKMYCVIDYSGVTLPIALTEFYGQFVKHAVEEYSVTTVRYTSDVLMRASLRVVGMTIHKPSNLYATKEDAIEVVRKLRANKMTIEDSTK